jgi:hypothetical protein
LVRGVYRGTDNGFNTAQAECRCDQLEIL